MEINKLSSITKTYEWYNAEKKILTNARCLSEGIDVPTLSGIAFVNPKQSQIDIIQAVGRAIRKSDYKKKGYDNNSNLYFSRRLSRWSCINE